MSWCSFLLLFMITMPQANLSSTPLDDPTKNMSLNEPPNDPPSQERGRQMNKKRKRILGGLKYTPTGLDCPDEWEVPNWEHWTASLRVRHSSPPSGGAPRDEDFRICSGVLISIKHILTALHCILDSLDNIVAFSDVEIYFDNEKVEKWKGIQFTPVGFYYMNMAERAPRLLEDKITVMDDIVVIKLNRKTTEEDDLVAIPLSTRDGIPAPGPTNVWIAGWGITELPKLPGELPQFPQFLQYTNKLPGIPCPQSDGIQSTHICFKNTDKDATCAGDSGSPGVVAINEVWHLQGIHTGGHQVTPCGSRKPQSISLNIDVYKYRTNIQQWMRL